MKKKILVFYQYFLPAFKAGGPIQSIANLCRQMHHEYDFYIVCGSKDHNEKADLLDIKKNVWNDFENGKAKVHYISASQQKKRTIVRLIKETNPDILFINGIYSPLFSLTPLIFSSQKKILSVRGMLHPGALSEKKLKKKVFIAFLKILLLQKKIIFHATDVKEKQFIQNIFGKKTKVIVAQNFPNQNMSPTINRHKILDELKLISVALISPMKNHALVLEALQRVKAKVTYDIYGPVKDAAYWSHCLTLIKSLPENITVNYKGSIEPYDLHNKLSDYHLFILPSKSENFGHAIYEALSSGLPVITSNFTPWNNLEANNAGYNIDIEVPDSVANAIEDFASFTNKDFVVWSKDAIKYAHQNVDLKSITVQYQKLFSS